MTDSSMLKYQYDTILDQMILLQLHAESPDCPCSLKGARPGELGEFCEPKHLRSIVALARETISMESDESRLDYLENLVLEGSELLAKMTDKLCDKEVELGDYATWSRDKRKPLEGFCYSGFCNIPQEDSLVEEVARMFENDKGTGKYFYPEFKPDPTFIHVGPGLTGIIPQELVSTKVQTKLIRSRGYDPAKAPVIKSPSDLQSYFRLMRNADQEWLLAIYADHGGHVIGADEISIGERSATLLSVDTIYRSAILLNASKIFLAHNHPSGLPKPSEEDIKAFESMRAFCPLMNIAVEDFFVVGAYEDYSMRGEKTIPAPPSQLGDIARMFRKKEEPRWCHPVKETDKEIGKLYRTLGTARKRISEIQRHLDIPLNICRGQAEMFESTTGVLDPYGSRCRDPETGQWIYSEECGYEPAGITTTALGMDGVTRYEFEFKIISADKLVVSHDPFTFTPNPNYPEELQPRLRERAATKIQVDKIAANLEPDAVITDFHVIDRGTPIIGQDTVVEAGNGRVMGIIKAAADHPEKYAAYKDRLREKARDYGLSAKDVDSIDRPILVRVRITDVDRTTFTQEANQAATIAPSAIENARTDAQKITRGMLAELIVGENESLEDALRAPKNQAFANRFLATLPENVQAALVDAQGYLNRDGVHRMAMAVFVSAFQGDPGLRLAEKAFESVDMDVRNTVNAIARSLGPLAQAEALTRTGERDSVLSIGDDLAQTVNVYSAIKRNPALTVEKYLAQEQIFARELTPFQEKILVVLEEYKRSPKKLADIFTAYAEGVIKAPPPAQATLMPGVEISKEGLWESAVKAPELQPAFMEVTRMFDETCDRPSAKYRYLSTFFTESAVEAALFMAEEGSTERKIDTVLAKLESGIEAIHDSDNFKDFIDTMSKFHNYSLGNIMLITLQRPDAARVAGYSTWQDLGRNVRKGEHGIMILAPCFAPRPKKEKEEEDEEEIEPEPQPIYFKVVHVFDIGQTEGKEMPRVEVPVITGEETGPLFQRASTYVAKQGINLDSQPRPDLEPDLMGFWSKPNNLIWVRPDVPQDQRTKTLLHEIAHAGCEMKGAREAEVMAESVAYTVANHFGYDTGARSFPYVALWAKDVKLLKSNLEIIRKVAKDMIEGIEHVSELSEPARLSGTGDKHDVIKSILDMEIWLGQLDLGKTRDRVKSLAKLKMAELELLWRDLLTTKYGWERIVEQSVYSGLGKKVPAYLQEVARMFAPMKLLTKEIRDKLPSLYSQENVEDPIVRVKFFTPDSNWTWYVIEGSAILDDGTQVEASYADRNLRDVRGRSEEGEVQTSTGKDDVQFAEAVSKLAHSFNEEKGLLSNERSGQSDVARRPDGELGVCIPTEARASQSEQSWLREESQSGVGGEDRQSAGERGAGAPQGRGQDERRSGEFGAEGAWGASEIAHGGKEEGERPVRKVVDYIFFGWIVGFEKELGYFRLKELESARGPMGLAIERDKWFKPMPLSEVKKLHAHEHGELGEVKSTYWLDKSKDIAFWKKGTNVHLIRGVQVPVQKQLFPGTVVSISLDWQFYDVIKKGKSILSDTGDLSQGAMGTIGAAAITGAGIAVGFKLVDWLAGTFRKKESKEGEMANTEHFCLDGDAWFELQTLIGKGEKQKAMDIMWSKGMKLVLAPMVEKGSLGEDYEPSVYMVRKFGGITYIFYKHVSGDKEAMKLVDQLYQNWKVRAIATSVNDIWVPKKDAPLLINPDFLKRSGLKEADQEELEAVDRALEKAEEV